MKNQYRRQMGGLGQFANLKGALQERGRFHYFLRYAHMGHAKSLLKNIQKQQSMLKISLIFKKFTNFTGKQLENSQDNESKLFRVLCLYERKHIARFSNLHQCSFTFQTIYKLISFSIHVLVLFITVSVLKRWLLQLNLIFMETPLYHYFSLQDYQFLLTMIENLNEFNTFTSNEFKF